MLPAGNTRERGGQGSCLRRAQSLAGERQDQQISQQRGTVTLIWEEPGGKCVGGGMGATLAKVLRRRHLSSHRNDGRSPPGVTWGKMAPRRGNAGAKAVKREHALCLGKTEGQGG